MAPSDYSQNCVRSLGKRKVSGKTCESPPRACRTDAGSLPRHSRIVLPVRSIGSGCAESRPPQRQQK